MRSFITTGLLTFALATTALAADTKPAAGKYNIDPMHSKVGFEIPHLVISSVEGHFKTFSGAITIDDKFEKSKIETEVDITSIDTSVGDRDTHLKSPDFFDAAKYPKMTFKSSAIMGTPQAFKLTGDLTIKGKTKKVTFDAVYKGSVVDAYGNHKIAFTANTKISRKEFGLTWGKMVEAGPVVGDEVTIDLKIQAAKDVPAKK
jgi:polyisoprenoid-binding protein YceI